MISSISAELLLLRKRVATWILLTIWMAMAAVFGYLVPYLTYRNNPRGAMQAQLADLLPGNLVGNLLIGFPFFGGVLVLILGVLVVGSEYGWGTIKTLFTQRRGRLQIFGAKLAALAAALLVFVLADFAVSALSSLLIARREDAAVDWPSVWLVVRGIVAAWLILAVWAALGVLLAVFFRGTALAIGIGILYGLVIEGLISTLFDQVRLLRPLAQALLRTNAYSLVEPLGVSVTTAAGAGPGMFSGPYVGGVQASLVLAAYLAGFILLAALLLRQRDVA